LTYLTLFNYNNRPMVRGIKDMGSMTIWKSVVIIINLSTFVICKNGPSIINIKSILYLYKIIFLLSLVKYILITEKLLVLILNEVGISN